MLRDVVVIGGSMGSFGVIKSILRELPVDFPAAVLIVNHIGASVDLRAVYAGASQMPVSVPRSGDGIVSGHVYVAARDAHLLLHDDHVLIRRGPRENLSRPAIDPLFRSAAAAKGRRVIAVQLSGALNDGAAGLVAIKRCGGIVIVQDPGDAEIRSMPEAALHAVVADHCVAGAEIPALLKRLVGVPVREPTPVPSDIQLEIAIAACEPASMALEDGLGERSPFSCPDCDGVLWQVQDEHVMRYRCHVGHAIPAAAMLEAKTEAADAMLWRLLRLHEERAAIARKMAEEAAQQPAAAEQFATRAAGYEEDATTIRRLLVHVPRSNSH